MTDVDDTALGQSRLSFLQSHVFYNCVIGPFTFDATLAAPNGPQEFITVDVSDLQATTIIEESTVRLFRGALESTRVKANYFVADVGGKLLIVKLDTEFSGDSVEGRLNPLPNILRTKIETHASSELSLHPAVLDASQISYRWDFNLFRSRGGTIIAAAGSVRPLHFMAKKQRRAPQ